MSVTCGRSVVFFPGTPVSSTNKTYRHNVTEILLKDELNTITLTLNRWDCLPSFCVLFPMLHMSLDCPFLITPSVFSNVYVDCYNKVNTDVLVRKCLPWNDQLVLGESGFLFLVMTKYIDYMPMKNVLKTSYRLNIYKYIK